MNSFTFKTIRVFTSTTIIDKDKILFGNYRFTCGIQMVEATVYEGCLELFE